MPQSPTQPRLRLWFHSKFTDRVKRALRFCGALFSFALVDGLLSVHSWIGGAGLGFALREVGREECRFRLARHGCYGLWLWGGVYISQRFGLELGESVLDEVLARCFLFRVRGDWARRFRGWGGVFGDFANHVAADIEFDAVGIFYGDVESFDDEVGAAQVDVVADQGVDDFHERGLDGFFVFELRDGVKAGAGRSFDAAQHALMEVAELLSAHGGRAALDSGDLDVLAVANVLV